MNIYSKSQLISKWRDQFGEGPNIEENALAGYIEVEKGVYMASRDASHYKENKLLELRNSNG